MPLLKPEIQTYVDQGLLNSKCAADLSEREIKNLTSPNIIKLINSKTISIKHALFLEDEQRKALENDNIFQKVVAGELDLFFVAFPHVQKYIDSGAISFEFFLSLSYRPRYNLINPNVDRLIESNILSLEQALSLTYGQEHALKNDTICQAVIDGELDLTVVAFPLYQKYIDNGSVRSDELSLFSDFASYHADSNIIRLIDTNTIGLDQVPFITRSQAEALKDESVCQAVIDGELELCCVEFPRVQDYINSGSISLEQVKLLQYDERNNLKSANVIRLIDSNIISLDRALSLSAGKLKALEQDDILQAVIDGELDLYFVECPRIQEYIASGDTSFERFLSLSKEEKSNLRSTNVTRLIDNKIISFEQALLLTKNQRAALKQDNIYKSVLAGELNIFFVEFPQFQEYFRYGAIYIEQLLDLDAKQKKYINSPNIIKLIEQDILSFKQLLSLTSWELESLAKPEVSQAVLEGKLKLDFIQLPFLQKYVDSGAISFDQFKKISFSKKLALQDKRIMRLLDTGVISICEALSPNINLGYELHNGYICQAILEQKIWLHFVEYPYLQKLVKNKIASLSKVYELSLNEQRNLNSANIILLLESKAISFDQALAVTEAQREALESYSAYKAVADGELPLELVEFQYVRKYFDNKLISLEEIRKLSSKEKENLSSKYVMQLVDLKVLSINQAKALTFGQRLKLKHTEVFQALIAKELDFEFIKFPLLQTYFNSGAISLEQIKPIDSPQSDMLFSRNILNLVDSNVMSIEKLLSLRYSEGCALRTDDICQAVLSGKLNLQFIKYPYMQQVVGSNARIKSKLEKHVKKRQESFEAPLIELPSVRSLISSKHIDFEYVVDSLSYEEVWALKGFSHYSDESPEQVCQAVLAGILDIRFIDVPYLQKYIDNGSVKLEENLSSDQRKNLRCENIQKLLKAKVLTINQVLSLDGYSHSQLDSAKAVEYLLTGKADGYFYTIPGKIRSQAYSVQEIRKNVRLIAQGRRNAFDSKVRNPGFFAALPSELGIKIAALTGNPVSHDSDQAEEIAAYYYSNLRK